MKKLFLFLIFGLLVTAVPVSAAVTKGGEVPRVEAGEIVNDDLFIGGESVEIHGTVNGDVYAASSKRLSISGTVNGDVIAVAGETLEITGTVKGSVRTISSVLNLTGASVGNSLSAFAESMTLDKDSSVAGGLIFAGSDAAIRAKVGRGITGAAGAVSLDNEVGRDVRLSASELTLNSGTKINGNLTYDSEKDLIRNQGAVVTAGVKRVEREKKEQQPVGGPNWTMIVWGFVSMALVGLALIRFMPTAAPGIAGAISNRPWAALGFGFLALISILPACFILLFSLVGIPLGILLFVGFMVAAYLSTVFVALAFGGAIAARTQRPASNYAYFLIGLTLLTILGIIPFIGGWVKFATALLGLGGIAIYENIRLAGPRKTPQA
ncbi:MAG TPA: hypothetical protein VNA68_02515 [Candidatus Dormibacteraeota bacterium]|nr:hypothetical protein [Candidatus Dormibacteraeota bacterium]